MIHFDLPKEQSSIIKVIGVGGGGSNAVNYMHSLGIGGVDFIVCNTDAQALANSRVPNKIQLGPSLTQGLGAGANPEIGRQATQESLDEIRKILEVNTKMAFVTAGMGGGTGTGGAPIIANICRDMGILTVGIVTTPFTYEGKKRFQHAEHGIEQLKSCVDTLLVISNDKLRHQFGNLTMSAALSTADNVLATAAKCITDVINTTGQINVDFADVCTVMRNGGVAILGSAKASGEDRAQLAIQQALNSPLLDNSDIKGAKWVLININSSTGTHEFTMDEVDTIQEYLLSQAGTDAEVILGLGYDESLGDEVSVTIIATGFEQTAHTVESITVKQEPKDERVMFTLDMNVKPKAEIVMPAAKIEEEINPVSDQIVKDELVQTSLFFEDEISSPIVENVKEELFDEVNDEMPIVFELELPKMLTPVLNENRQPLPTAIDAAKEEKPSPSFSSVRPAQPSIGGFLQKPSMIYATEPAQHVQQPQPVQQVQQAQPVQEIPQPVEHPIAKVEEIKEPEMQEEESMQLIIREDLEVTRPIVLEQPETQASFEEPIAGFDEAEAQKAKAAERLYKLRNLSYNFNASDPNNEYENIPAYVRHNLQVHNTTLASVEKFYSSYAVGTDENNVTQISTINTFLEGKKPD